MTEDKKLHAKFDWDDYRNDGDCSSMKEVKDLAEAVMLGISMQADFFSTYTQGIVIVGGKTYTGELEPQAGRHYLQQEKVYTPAEVIAQIRSDEAKSGPAIDQLMADMKKHGMGKIAGDLSAELSAAAGRENPLVTQAKKEPDTTRYAKLRWQGFVKLQDGETAWDANGKQLWPAQPASPRAKPTGEFDL